MARSNFRGLKVWTDARELVRDVYRETQEFPRVEIFGLTQQMRRAAISIVCNLAEGQGRRTPADGRQFAVIARGSAFEIEAQLVIATDLGYIDAARAEELIEKSLEVVRMINGLIRHYDDEAG
ncbi:MAG TPA: four helix bundle protein [Thermoanaerobaculia bacterium]|jgi:four helix bundle protein